MTKIEPVLMLLALLLVFFTGCLFFSEWAFPMDGQIFQVISGLVTGLAGAFLMRVKPRNEKGDVDSTDTSILKLNAPVGGNASASVENKS